MKTSQSFNFLAVSCLVLFTASSAFCQHAFVSLCEAGEGVDVSKIRQSTGIEELSMGPAVTVSGTGLITGAVSQSFGADAALVECMSGAQEAAGMNPDHVVPSFSGPLIVASTDVRSLVDGSADSDFSEMDDRAYEAQAGEELVLQVFGRNEMEASAMLGDPYQIEHVVSPELSEEPFGVGSEPSSASVMGLVGFLLVSVRRRKNLATDRGNSDVAGISDDW